jgi:hypothetical protein
MIMVGVHDDLVCLKMATLRQKSIKLDRLKY